VNNLKLMYILSTILLIGLVLNVPLTTAFQPASSFYISDITWNPSGATIAFGISTSSSNTCYREPGLYAVRIINSLNGSPVNEITNVDCSVEGLDFNPIGNLLLISQLGFVQIWDLSSNQYKSGYSAANEFHNVQWSSDGSEFFIASLSGVTVITPDETVQGGIRPIAAYTDWRETGRVTVAAWGIASTGSHPIAIGTENGTVLIWDQVSDQLLLTVSQHTSSITSVAWNTQVNQIATADENGEIQIWDPLNGTAIHILQDHTGEITKIVWRPDGQYVASASLDGTVRIWDAHTGMQVGILQLTGGVYALDWSPDGSQIAYGGIFDPQNPNPIIASPPGVITPTATTTTTPPPYDR